MDESHTALRDDLIEYFKAHNVSGFDALMVMSRLVAHLLALKAENEADLYQGFSLLAEYLATETAVAYTKRKSRAS